MPIELLSGGNQQKVVVGRWLHLQGKIYVFEDPTAGVDVGAKAEIYRLFDVALKRGAAIMHRVDRFRGGRERSATVRSCSIAARSSRSSRSEELSVENLLAAASASIGRSEGERSR